MWRLIALCTIGLCLESGYFREQQPEVTIDAAGGRRAIECNEISAPLPAPMFFGRETTAWPLTAAVSVPNPTVHARSDIVVMEVRIRATADVVVPTSLDRCRGDGSSWRTAVGPRQMTIWTEAIRGPGDDGPNLMGASLFGAESVQGSLRLLRAGDAVVVRLADRMAWEPHDGRAMPKQLNVRAVVSLADGVEYRPSIYSTRTAIVQMK
jgi:hypothetical protein